jgi:segregation and condensation protein A
MQSSYKVQLDVFEGPLDLLLFLIRKEEVNIYDIPIAKITRQYLDYIQIMRLLNLDIAGDFIVMASTLIRIKAKTLLPPTGNEEEGEAEDPRTELVQNLLEYQEYKKLADNLDERQAAQREIFFRFTPPEQVVADSDSMLDVSLFDLLAAFKEAMDAAPEEVFHEVQRQNISVEERIAFITEYLEEKKRVQFFDMFPKGTAKLILVVTFVALLELIKNQKVKIGQSQAFGDIWIYLNDGITQPDTPETPEPVAIAETPNTPKTPDTVDQPPEQENTNGNT